MIINIFMQTSVHSEECHLGLQSLRSTVLQSSNVVGLLVKSHSSSSAKPSLFIQTTVRDLDAFQQSPIHCDHGP